MGLLDGFDMSAMVPNAPSFLQPAQPAPQAPQGLLSAPQAAPQGPAPQPFNDHSTRNKWFALLTGGVPGLLHQIAQQDYMRGMNQGRQAAIGPLAQLAQQPGMTVRDPRWQAASAAALRSPFATPADVAAYEEIIKPNTVNLNNVNGFQIDPNDPHNTNRFVPSLTPGTMPDGHGGVANIGGQTQAMFGQTAATENAKQAATYNYAGPIALQQEYAKSHFSPPMMSAAGPNGETQAVRPDQYALSGMSPQEQGMLPTGGGAPPAPGQNVSGFMPDATGAPAGPPPGAPMLGGGAVPAGPAPTGGFQDYWNKVALPSEGGYNPHDANGAPVKYGINQGANPDVDVKNLTAAQAAKLAHDRYWVPSGADKLPANLASIHADSAYVFGVGAAKQMLQQSGGDPAKYLALREAKFAQLAASNPADAKYLPAWQARDQRLAQYAGVTPPQAVAGGPQAHPAANAPRIAQAAPGATPGVPFSGTVLPAIADQDKATVAALDKEAHDKQVLAGLAGEFMTRAQKSGVATGPGYKFPVIGDFARNVNPDAQDLDAITNRSYMLLRPPGSGRITNQELTAFKQAFPNLTNAPQVNAHVAQNLIQEAQQAAAEANFKRAYLQKNHNLDGADDAWQAQARSAGPAAHPSAGAPRMNAGGPKVGAIEDGYRFNGGNAADPRSWTKVH